MVKRLRIKVHLLVSNQRTETIYGNFTSRGQPHTPRVVVARDFGDDPLQRGVFSDVARGCIRTFTTQSMIRVPVYIVRRRLFMKWADVWCDNELKYDAAGFHCSSVPVL